MQITEINPVVSAVYSGMRKENVIGLKIANLTFYDLKPGAHADVIALD